MYFDYKHALVDKAKELRKNMTLEECKLWYQFLRRFPIRFLNQKVLDTYILDFYCSKARLCVEIDGLQHLTVGATEHDAVRASKLSQLGITTIRFANDEINLDFPSVCGKIERKVSELLAEKSERQKSSHKTE